MAYTVDFHYLRSLIEREHTNNDSVGSNTIPEGLETGEFIVNKQATAKSLKILTKGFLVCFTKILAYGKLKNIKE